MNPFPAGRHGRSRCVEEWLCAIRSTADLARSQVGNAEWIYSHFRLRVAARQAAKRNLRMFSFRHFQKTPQNYQLVVDINNRCWPDEPASTVEEVQFGDREWRKDKLYQRFFVEIEGKAVGVGSFLEPYWLSRQGKYQFGFDVDPKFENICHRGVTVFKAVESYVLRELGSREVLCLQTSAREDKANTVKWLEQNGYRLTMRYPVSKLRVADFDFSLFAGHVDRMEACGYRIYSLQELQHEDVNWRDKLFDTWSEIELDVPSPDPPSPMPRSEFNKMLRHPSFSASGWAVAVKRDEEAPGRIGEYAGVSANNPRLSRPDLWSIWLTGVRRAHRRKGIATALKLRSIEWARDRGIKEFETGNEENNPMYSINVKLGFTPEPAWTDWEKGFEALSGEEKEHGSD